METFTVDNTDEWISKIRDAGKQGLNLEQAAAFMGVPYGHFMAAIITCPEIKQAWDLVVAQQAMNALSLIKGAAMAGGKDSLRAATYLHKHYTELQSNNQMQTSMPQMGMHLSMQLDTNAKLIEILPDSVLKAIATDAVEAESNDRLPEAVSE